MKRSRLLPVFGLGACAAALAVGVYSFPRAFHPSERPAESERLAQTYSPKCQTASGICFVPAQPIGNACFCESTGQSGTIVP